MAVDPSQPETEPLRALDQRSSAEQAEAGAALIVTRNSRPITGVPDLDLPEATDEEIGATLHRMGGGLDD
ncbi:hypothetical protein ACIRPQ_33590 [Streptomyces sp. NPDC101213]|uniref:hypothetical protein n=1 Tax=Streptomyces sp. NPDC101213 TaxID=3366130 RepID=UPI00382D89FE